jgi:hypothetical protein
MATVIEGSSSLIMSLSMALFKFASFRDPSASAVGLDKWLFSWDASLSIIMKFGTCLVAVVISLSNRAVFRGLLTALLAGRFLSSDGSSWPVTDTWDWGKKDAGGRSVRRWVGTVARSGKGYRALEGVGYESSSPDGSMVGRRRFGF